VEGGEILSAPPNLKQRLWNARIQILRFTVRQYGTSHAHTHTHTHTHAHTHAHTPQNQLYVRHPHFLTIVSKAVVRARTIKLLMRITVRLQLLRLVLLWFSSVRKGIWSH
jgi:hypothetical protein